MAWNSLEVHVHVGRILATNGRRWTCGLGDCLAPISPLLAAYKFLASHWDFVPSAPADTSVLTIVVNICLLIAMVMFYGSLVSLTLLAFASSEKTVLGNIGKSLLLSVFALAFWFAPGPKWPPDGMAGMALYFYTAFLFSLLSFASPIVRLLNRYYIQFCVCVGMLTILSILLIPQWIRGLWHFNTDQSDFVLVPLSCGSINSRMASKSAVISSSWPLIDALVLPIYVLVSLA